MLILKAMDTRTILRTLTPLAAATLLCACNNTPLVSSVGFATGVSDNPDPTATATATPGETPVVDPTPAPVPTPALSCGSVVVRDLKIWGDTPNGPVYENRAWADVNLADPDASDLNDVPVDAGTYDRVRFTIHKRVGVRSGGPGTGDPKVNDSIHLCGTWQGVAFEYEDDVTTDVDRRDPGGVTIDANGPARLMVVFDSAHWFDGIDLAQAKISPDGIAHLDRTSNTELARALRENFVASVRLANQTYR